jgi:hypothetical protein
MNSFDIDFGPDVYDSNIGYYERSAESFPSSFVNESSYLSEIVGRREYDDDDEDPTVDEGVTPDGEYFGGNDKKNLSMRDFIMDRGYDDLLDDIIVDKIPTDVSNIGGRPKNQSESSSGASKHSASKNSDISPFDVAVNAKDDDTKISNGDMDDIFSTIPQEMTGGVDDLMRIYSSSKRR